MTRKILDIFRLAARFAYLTAIPLCFLGAFLLRFEFDVPAEEAAHLRGGLLVAFVVKALVFTVARFDLVVWRFVSLNDLRRTLAVNVVASALVAPVLLLAFGTGFPRSVYAIDFLLCFLATAAIRVGGRVFSEARWKKIKQPTQKTVIIYGAGGAGNQLAREIRKNPQLGYELIGFIDDNPRKRQARIEGAPVLGCGRSAPEIVDMLRKRRRKVSEIVIAMPTASGREMAEALANCRAAGITTKTIPGLSELLTGKVLSAQIRDVSVTDLLGREPVQIEEQRITASIAGRAVMVTGAAGSIGSELCRQIADHAPSVLVAFDQAESDLFRIDHELRRKFPKVPVVAVLGDIRDRACLEDTLQRYRIRAIFHAAAYKHVPMMEAFPLEAIRNNIFGTYNLVQTAWEQGIESFVMISSDKAVNPTSIMGATKRVDEMILSSMPSGGTRFVSVRFGNVLGSNGSVIPTFQKQIEEGGPVTVTHPDMKRYFMTIREAVQLVLLASTMGKGSEIFVLDMGKPVLIADLARQMVRLSGKVPDEEIEIRFTGLRPGEKLYEEINTGFENMIPTAHQKIRVFQSVKTEQGEILDWLDQLQDLLDRRDAVGVVQQLTEMIPEFTCDAHWRASKPKAAKAMAAAGGAR